MFSWSKKKERVDPAPPAPVTAEDLIARGVPAHNVDESGISLYEPKDKVIVPYVDNFHRGGADPVLEIIKVRKTPQYRFLVEYEDGSRMWRDETPNTNNQHRVLEIARRYHLDYLVEYCDKSRYWIKRGDIKGKAPKSAA